MTKDQRSFQEAQNMLDSIISRLGGLRKGVDTHALITKVLQNGRYRLTDNGRWANAQNIESQDQLYSDLEAAAFPFRAVKSDPGKRYIPKYNDHQIDTERSKRVKTLVRNYIDKNLIKFKGDPSWMIDQIAGNFEVHADQNGVPHLTKLYKGMYSDAFTIQDVIEKNMGNMIDRRGTEYFNHFENAKDYSALAVSLYGKRDLNEKEFERVKELAKEIRDYEALPFTDYTPVRDEGFVYREAMRTRGMYELDIADFSKMSLQQQKQLDQFVDQEWSKMNDPKLPEPQPE